MIYVVMVKLYKDDPGEPYGWVDSNVIPIDRVLKEFKYRHTGIRKYPYYYADSGLPIEGLPQIVEVKMGYTSIISRQFID